MVIENIFRLPFDQYQRYRLVAEAIPILEGEGPRFSILEVGAFPPRLKDFLPGREITALDRQAGPEPGCVRALASALPFADRAFDAVVSLDTLEHIAPDQRERFIAELCRTAARAVVIAAPFASEAVRAADRAIFEFIRERAGYEHPYLKEHLDLELPDLVATLVRMVDHGLDVQVVPSGRLDRWLMMMAAYYALDAEPELREALPFLMEAYNRAFYEFDKAEPAYRHCLIGAYAGLGRGWGQLADLASGEAADRADFRGLALVIELARTLALRQKDREIQALGQSLADREAELKALREHVRTLEDFMTRVKSTPLYLLYERLLKPFRRP